MKQGVKISLMWLGLSLMCRILIASDGTQSASPVATKPSSPAPSEIKTTDGKIYRHVEIQRIEPDGIAISYQPDTGGVGMAKLKFRDLPEGLQQQYGYDKQKAASFEADQLRKKAALQTRLQAESADAARRKAKRLADEERAAAEASKRRPPVLTPYTPETIETLRAKANAGDMGARAELARRDYETWYARRTEETRNQALASLKPLAEQGDSSSQLYLGYVLKTRSEWYDVQEGVKWIRAAADQGNVRAMLELGAIYKKSAYGVPKDSQEAIKWYRMAADKGIADPALGSLYEDAGDAIEALKWYAIAKRMHPTADGLYETLRSRMTEEQVAEAEKRASQFKVAGQ